MSEQILDIDTGDYVLLRYDLSNEWNETVLDRYRDGTDVEMDFLCGVDEWVEGRVKSVGVLSVRQGGGGHKDEPAFELEVINPEHGRHSDEMMILMREVGVVFNFTHPNGFDD